MVDTPAVLQGAETPSGSAKFSPSQPRILVQRRSHGHPEVFLLLLKVVAQSRGRVSDNRRRGVVTGYGSHPESEPGSS